MLTFIRFPRSTIPEENGGLLVVYLYHTDIYSLYRDTLILKIALLDCVRLYNEDFVK